MKGVILAGGSGTRLFPNTKVTNKHLLPVYNKPMIFYAIETMIKAGIKDILILPGKDNAGAFAQLLGSGAEFNVNFFYRIQESAAGLAYAVSLAEEFVGDDNFMVLFGDNIIFDDVAPDVANFTSGCRIFLKQVPDPHRHGIAEVSEDGRVVSIEEKPQIPKSNWAVIGAYLYDKQAFEFIRQLKPSSRGELEITDLNNLYIKGNLVTARYLESHWFDAGTHESLVEAASFIMDLNRPVERVEHKESNSSKVVAGFILYNAIKYLPEFLVTLKSQNYSNVKFIALDNNENPDNEDVRFLKENYSEIEIIRPGWNTGFGAGHNLMIKKAKELGAEFYAALNFDMLLENNFISELLNTILKNPLTGSVTGKIMRWDFDNKERWGNAGRSNFIDSTGLVITKGHRFLDRGQGEIDRGQYDIEEEIFGSSGAAVMYRMNALEDVSYTNAKGEKEYFDELMFMYKEDIDLAYRLQLAGYKCKYAPSAVTYHDRTVALESPGVFGTVKSRMNRAKKYKEWSWVNHHIILSKYLSTKLSFGVLASTVWFEFKQLIYILIFEPFLFKQFIRYLGLKNEIVDRKKQVKRRLEYKRAVEKWMI